MTKRLLLVLIFTIGTWLPMTTQPTPALAGPLGPCSGEKFYVHKQLSNETIRTRVKNLIRCATYRWPVAGGYPKALDVAVCESGLWPWAYGNGNAGVFQQRTRYWTGRAEDYLRREWFPKHWAYIRTEGWFAARANVLLSVRMAHSSGWQAWSCA